MISVITSVYNRHLFEQFARNLDETIGMPYELIGIDNSKGQMGLCEVYNKATQQARYDLLCYAHEDIRFRTLNWGEKIVQRFREAPRLGLLGVVGTLYKTYAPNGWGVSWEYSRANFIQHYKHSSEPVTVRYTNPAQEAVSRVVCVDGMWMCTPKKLAQTIGFDAANFRGFHCYDLDYSLSIRQQYEVGVTFDVQIEHFSEGSPDKNWIRESIKFHRKWKKNLPAAAEPVPLEIQQGFERQALDNFIYRMRAEGFGIFSILKVVVMNLRNPLIGGYSQALLVRLLKEHLKFNVLGFQWLRKTAVKPKP